jgi:uncharacterized protein
MKYLLWLGVIAAVWWVWSKRQEARNIHPTQDTNRETESMVRCAHCGVYLPASDSVSDGEQAYCCAAHRASGPANH